MYTEVLSHKSKNEIPCWRVRVVENSRVNGKPRKRYIRSLGVAHSEKEVEDLRRLGAKIIESELAKKHQSELLFDSAAEIDESSVPERAISSFTNLRETARTKEGVHQVFGTLFDSAGFDRIFPEQTTKILKNIVTARIEAPASKRKTQRYLDENKVSDASLNDIYRMMDKLCGKIDLVNEIAISDAKSLFENKIDLVLFDVTTLYFESTNEDSLRAFGFSKDQKFHQTQVVLAMGVTRDGIPIGYKLFPGNTAETRTLIACLDEWKKHIEIGRVVFVADRGMFNAANIKELDNAGYEFVVAATLRRMNNDVKDKVMSFKETILSQKNLGSETRLLSISHAMQVQKPQQRKKIEEEVVEGRLLVSYSPQRSSKDKSDRDRILKKISKIVNDSKSNETKKLVSNKGYLKFAKFSGKSLVEVDQEKVNNDAKWDGIHGLFTNAKLSEQEIHDYYRQLWTIEETFRIGKTDLEMRPIYHFKEERIKAHIAICFISLYLLRKLQLLIKRSLGGSVSAEAIQEALERVQTSRVVDMKTGFRFLLPSLMSPLAKDIYKIVGLKRSEIPRPY